MLWEAGKLRINRTTAVTNAYQGVSVQAEAQYLLKMVGAIPVGPTTPTFALSTSIGGAGTVYASAANALLPSMVARVPSNTTLNICIISSSGNGSITADDVSMRKIL